jgi:hypothetical protein
MRSSGVITVFPALLSWATKALQPTHPSRCRQAPHFGEPGVVNNLHNRDSNAVTNLATDHTIGRE